MNKIAKAGAVSLALATLSGLGGCAYTEDVRGPTAEFQASFADVQNREIVLNIVRASLGHPFQFSNLSTIRGNRSFTTGFNLAAPLSGAPIGVAAGHPLGVAANFVLTPSAQITENPTFDLGNANTKEFIRGMSLPLTMDTIDYYVESATPHEFLFNLFIAKLEVGGIDYYNSPLHSTYKEFRRILRRLIDLGLSTEAVVRVQNIGAPLDESAAKSPDFLSKLVSSGFELVQVSDNPKTYQIQKKVQVSKICFDIGGQDALPAQAYKDFYDQDACDRAKQNPQTYKTGGKELYTFIVSLEGRSSELAAAEQKLTEANKQIEDAKKTAGGPKALSVPLQMRLQENLDSAKKLFPQLRTDRPITIFPPPSSAPSAPTNSVNPHVVVSPNEPSVTVVASIGFFPRSTLAVIQYLGEVVKAKAADPNVDIGVRASSGVIEPIIVVDSPDRVKEPMVTVEYRGHVYSVPTGSEGGFSTRTMTLLSLLRATFTSETDLPKTGVVQVIGVP